MTLIPSCTKDNPDEPGDIVGIWEIEKTEYYFDGEMVAESILNYDRGYRGKFSSDQKFYPYYGSKDSMHPDNFYYHYEYSKSDNELIISFSGEDAFAKHHVDKLTASKMITSDYYPYSLVNTDLEFCPSLYKTDQYKGYKIFEGVYGYIRDGYSYGRLIHGYEKNREYVMCNKISDEAYGRFTGDLNGYYDKKINYRKRCAH